MAGTATAARRREETEEEGGRLMKEDPVVIFRKDRDSTVMLKQLSNPSSNEDGPKSKSVGFFKIYNFALRFICR
jgi:hypothetical protein